MKHYAYLRVSTDAQDVANQKHGVMSYCLDKGFAPVQWVEDVVSGKVSWRERALGKVIEKAEAGDNIIVSEVSRIGRNTLTVLEVMEAARKKGIAIHIVKQNMIADNSTASHITITVLGMAAQIERELISSRTKEALQKRKSEGVILGRPKGKAKRLKLDDQKEKINEMLKKKVSKAAIARIMEVSITTLDRWIDRQPKKQKQIDIEEFIQEQKTQ